MFLPPSQDTCGQTQVVARAEVVVTAARLADQPGLPVGRSVASIARTVPGVVADSQGGAFGQTDLSIRGSSFSGAGLSIGGLALQNPQTEHFHAELPIPAALFSLPAVLAGFEQVLRSEGHLVGSLALDLLPLAPRRCRATVGVGDHSSYRADFLAQHSARVPECDVSVGLGTFGSAWRADRIDEQGNDSEGVSYGGQLELRTAGSRADIVVGQQTREFGVRGYYGVTPAWDAAERLEDLIILGQWMLGEDKQQLEATALWRETEDDYELFWDREGTYHNRHRTTVAGCTLAGRHGFRSPLRWNWRAGAYGDEIRSNALGNHDRAGASATVIPEYRGRRWALMAGMRLIVHDDHAPEYMPQAAIESDLGPVLVVGSYSEAVREPSYTELNYDSPGSLGDAGLRTQKRRSVELRAVGEAGRRVEWSVGGFVRETKHTVDWILADGTSTRWTASDLGTVETRGIEAEVRARPTSDLNIAAHYACLEKDAGPELHASRYALDYPEHLLRVSASWSPFGWLTLSAAQSFRQQEQNAARRGADSQSIASIAARGHVPRCEWLELALRVENLWDDDFQELPGQDTSTGRRVSAEATIAW